MTVLTPGIDRFQTRALLKASRTSVVTHLSEVGSDRSVVGRCLVPPTAASEVALLEGIAREAARLQGLRHPALPRFDRVVEGEGGTWMLWGFETGTSLAQYRGMELELPETWVLWWLRTLLQALQTLHSQSPPWFVGHIEPSDMVIRDDRLWLVDLALFERIFPERAALSHHAFEHMIAPEKRTSPQSSVATDLFSAGAVAFWLLTGRAPAVTGAGSAAAMRAGLVASRPSLEPGVADLVVRLLEFYPSQRPDSAEQALSRLSPFVTVMKGQRPPAPKLESEHKFAAEATRLINEAPAAIVVDEAGLTAPPVETPPARPRPLPWLWMGAAAVGLLVCLVSLHPIRRTGVPLPTLPTGPSRTSLGDSQDWGHHCTVACSVTSSINGLTWDGTRYEVSLLQGHMNAHTGAEAGIDVHTVENTVIHIDPGSEVVIDTATHLVKCQCGSMRIVGQGHERTLGAGSATSLVAGGTN